MLGGHTSYPKLGTLQFVFIEYLEDREFIVPKGQFDIKRSFERTISDLGLAGRVRNYKGRQGWVYEGITLLKNQGKPIVVRVNPAVKLLRSTPVLTWMNGPEGATPFETRGMASNNDLIKAFQDTSKTEVG